MSRGGRSSVGTTGVAPPSTWARPAPWRARAAHPLGRPPHSGRLAALSHACPEGRAGGRPHRGPRVNRRRSRLPRWRPSLRERLSPQRGHRGRLPRPRLPGAARSSASAAPRPRGAPAGSLRSHCGLHFAGQQGPPRNACPIEPAQSAPRPDRTTNRNTRDVEPGLAFERHGHRLGGLVEFLSVAGGPKGRKTCQTSPYARTRCCPRRRKTPHLQAGSIPAGRTYSDGPDLNPLRVSERIRRASPR
jgi:hypothetical protein